MHDEQSRLHKGFLILRAFARARNSGDILHYFHDGTFSRFYIIAPPGYLPDDSLPSEAEYIVATAVPELCMPVTVEQPGITDEFKTAVEKPGVTDDFKAAVEKLVASTTSQAPVRGMIRSSFGVIYSCEGDKRTLRIGVTGCPSYDTTNMAGEFARQFNQRVSLMTCGEKSLSLQENTQRKLHRERSMVRLATRFEQLAKLLADAHENGTALSTEFSFDADGTLNYSSADLTVSFRLPKAPQGS